MKRVNFSCTRQELIKNIKVLLSNCTSLYITDMKYGYIIRDKKTITFVESNRDLAEQNDPVEIVQVTLNEGKTKLINIDGDSELATISDIIKALS